MIATTAAQIAQVTGGKIVCGSADVSVTSLSTDTRSVEPGQLFVALVGDNFDAHTFLESAIFAGAAVLIVSRLPEDCETGNATIVLCDDTLKALQDFASWHRETFPHPVIGITGSNGKTSTKDFTRSVLAQKYCVNATAGNLNNHIGLPLSVLAATSEHTCSVLEMGMNHPGEIAPLCEICRPNIGIITNVGTAHIEYMGSREAIAEEKGALGRSLSSEGELILSAGGDFNEKLKNESRATTIIVGEKDSSIQAKNISTDQSQASFTLVIEGSAADVVLPVSGEHMIMNALLAAAAGWSLGIDVEAIALGLTGAQLTSGRMRSFESRGVFVFDDTYNANPDSVAAGIQALAKMNFSEGVQRYVVLGNMAELGDYATTAYEQMGKLAAQCEMALVTVGKEASLMAETSAALGGSARAFDSIDEASVYLKSSVKSGDAVLFKGSRLAGMERVMNEVFPES